MPQTPPAIFDTSVRRAKRRRAASRFADHDFLHRRAAEDVVDRLETILRPFDEAVAAGPGAGLLRDVMTDKAEVGRLVTIDEIPGADLEADFARLPIEDDRLDLAVSFMTLQAENDPLVVLKEMRRVLKPDGLLIAVLPGERTLFELRQALRTAETEVLGRVAPRIAPMMAVKDGGALMQAAGLALPVSDVARVTVEYSAPGKLFADLRGTGETNALLQTPKGALRRDVLAATIAAYRATHGTPDGGIRATVDLVTLTGWKPHPAQPKPLKPGSATTSMADAIRKAGQN